VQGRSQYAPASPPSGSGADAHAHAHTRTRDTGGARDWEGPSPQGPVGQPERAVVCYVIWGGLRRRGAGCSCTEGGGGAWARGRGTADAPDRGGRGGPTEYRVRRATAGRALMRVPPAARTESARRGAGEADGGRVLAVGSSCDGPGRSHGFPTGRDFGEARAGDWDGLPLRLAALAGSSAPRPRRPAPPLDRRFLSKILRLRASGARRRRAARVRAVRRVPSASPGSASGVRRSGVKSRRVGRSAFGVRERGRRKIILLRASRLRFDTVATYKYEVSKSRAGRGPICALRLSVEACGLVLCVA
jgi:hypothetical protein